MSNNLFSRLKQRLSSSLESAEPSYEKDISGPLQRWDERETLFARQDLIHHFEPQSPQYQSYYTAHPKQLAYDTHISQLPELGHTGGGDRPMFTAQFATIAKLGQEGFVSGEPASRAIPIPPSAAAQKVKALAHFLGADLVKIGPLRQQWVYTHVGRSKGDAAGFQPWGTPIDLRHHPHAIALGFQMDYELIQTAPNFPTLLASAQGYANGAWVSVQLAEYIRQLGYSARAHHFTNYQLLAVPVAVDCGLGELSRAGYLITLEFGLAVRLAIVTTDMPLTHDQPVDLGVQSSVNSVKSALPAAQLALSRQETKLSTMVLKNGN